MDKESAILGQWRRRFFVLSKTHPILAYYTTEKITRSRPKSLFLFLQVHPITLSSIKNGLRLQLHSGKDLKLKTDTQLGFREWYDCLHASAKLYRRPVGSSNIILSTSSSSRSGNKSGYVQYRFPEGHWERLWMTLDQDSISFFTHESAQDMKSSGLVRKIGNWDHKPLGLILILNRQRTIYIAFDSLEDKTSWTLMLEFVLAQKKSVRRVSDAAKATEEEELWI